MNKKAYVFVTFVVILTFFALLGALLVLNVKYKVKDVNMEPRIIGQKQAELFKTYQIGENTRFYISQSAKYAAVNTIKALAGDSGCGIYHGYSIWSDADNQCFPKKEEAENKFKERLDIELALFLGNYEDLLLNEINYKLSIENELKIIGISDNVLVISIDPVEEIQDITVPSPIIWPANGPITSCYGWRILKSKPKDWHDGIDIGVPANTDIVAIADGKVEKICNEWTGPCACSVAPDSKNLCTDVKECRWRCENSGNYVIIKHTDTFYTKYNHLSEIKKDLKQGDKVKQGQIIAKSGDTGYSEGAHLDFKIYFSKDGYTKKEVEDSYERNPLCYLPSIQYEFGKDAYSCRDIDGTSLQFCPITTEALQPAISPADNTYSIIPNFKVNIKYSFDEYKELNATSRKIAEEATQQCYGKNVNFNNCINSILSSKTDFKWEFECEKEENEQELSNKMLRLCAESKKYSFLAEKGIVKPVLYKIAVFAGDTIAPGIVENVKVSNTEDAEKNITITFNANKELDMGHYEVYYSEKEFTVIDENVLGLGTIQHTDKETYTSTFKVPEDAKTYYFAVIAVDTSDNKGTFEETVQGISIDNLNPGPVEKVEFAKLPGVDPILDVTITPATLNTDGTEIDDLSQYTVYIKEIPTSSCNINDVANTLSSLKSTKYEKVQFIEEEGKHKLQATIKGQPIALPLEDYKLKKFCLVVIAEDEISKGEEGVKPARYSLKSRVFIDGSAI